MNRLFEKYGQHQRRGRKEVGKCILCSFSIIFLNVSLLFYVAYLFIYFCLLKHLMIVLLKTTKISLGFYRFLTFIMLKKMTLYVLKSIFASQISSYLFIILYGELDNGNCVQKSFNFFFFHFTIRYALHMTYIF